jgi:tetratricopeptide (TPR) repeat protein
MFLPKTNRKIIPRWRDFLTTAALGQLGPSSINGSGPKLPTAPDIEAREAWVRSRTLWHALDLVGSAFVIGDSRDEEVQSAARYIESRGEDCPLVARQLVARLLHSEHDDSRLPEVAPADEEGIRTEIHSKRKRVHEEPRNSILWIDIARLYTSVGQHKKAEQAVEAAFRLGSENRFILLAAARFFVHIGAHDRALRILRGTTLSQSDPWVVAAEIGVSTFYEVGPKFLKTGRRMLGSDDFSAFTTSELASAIATVELNEGNTKGAKKLFKQSLTLPTENSAAQAEWAYAQVGQLGIRPSPADIPRNYEAQALYAYRLSDWNNAVWNARQWLSDQPFSSRPAGVASYLYSSILERYEESIRILRFSLISNPRDRGLTNNLVFTLINLGRLAEAESTLNTIDPTAADDLSTITLIATKGLLLFRKGHPEAGRNLYLDAIALAKRKGNRRYAALAALHLAIEEIQADMSTKAETFKTASKLARAEQEPDVKHIYDRLLKFAKAAKLSE